MRFVRVAVAAILACLLLSLDGCATTEAAVKNAADACKSTAWDDVVSALPFVAQLTICEIQHEDCSAIVHGLESLGISDLPGVQKCALSETHDASVALMSSAPK